MKILKYRPQKDITAYELGKILTKSGSIRYTQFEIGLLENESEEVKRHLEFEEIKEEQPLLRKLLGFLLPNKKK